MTLRDWFRRWFGTPELPTEHDLRRTEWAISERGLAFIKSWEGFSPVAYADVGGVATIGHGHVIKPGEAYTRLSESQADALLRMDVFGHEERVNRYVSVPLSQARYDALVAWDYNTGAIHRATLTRLLNEGNYHAAGDELLKWNKVGGIEVYGLVRRRHAEREMFLSAVYRGSDGRMV